MVQKLKTNNIEEQEEKQSPLSQLSKILNKELMRVAPIIDFTPLTKAHLLVTTDAKCLNQISSFKAFETKIPVQNGLRFDGRNTYCIL